MNRPSIFTLAFWIAASERSIKSAAQAAVLFIGADQANVLEFDWAALVGFALGGAVLSYLTSLATGAVGNTGPSAANEALTL